MILTLVAHLRCVAAQRDLLGYNNHLMALGTPKIPFLRDFKADDITVSAVSISNDLMGFSDSVDNSGYLSDLFVYFGEFIHNDLILTRNDPNNFINVQINQCDLLINPVNCNGVVNVVFDSNLDTSQSPTAIS